MTTEAAKTDKKKSPIKKSAKKSTEAKAGKQSVAAYMHWSTPLANGQEFKSSKGIAIFQNPEYVDAKMDTLIELAKEHGGVVEMNMKVRIQIAKPAQEAPAMDQFITVKPQ